MTRETFERELLACLEEQRRLRLAMEMQDAVKLIFQAMLGVGHLLSDRETVAGCIAREMASLTPEPSEPLLEKLSPCWCRLNLRRARAEGLTPDTVAGLMLASRAPMTFTRLDVWETCRKLGLEKAEPVLEEDWLPSHSDVYRERYHPAYRVISADWSPCIDAVLRIAKANAERLLITLDGPCATGKTTLAERLAQVFRCPVIHTDDFVIPHAQKTPERLAVPGGNCDAERLAAEVLAPWKRGEAVRYRKYDWNSRSLAPEETLPDSARLILEGSYCNLPAIRAYADVRLFLTAPLETRLSRLRQRESPESLRGFFERWIPLENAYIAAYRLPDEGCAVIAGKEEMHRCDY